MFIVLQGNVRVLKLVSNAGLAKTGNKDSVLVEQVQARDAICDAIKMLSYEKVVRSKIEVRRKGDSRCGVHRCIAHSRWLTQKQSRRKGCDYSAVSQEGCQRRRRYRGGGGGGFLTPVVSYAPRPMLANSCDSLTIILDV